MVSRAHGGSPHVRAPQGHQVSSASGLRRGMDRHLAPPSPSPSRTLDDVLRWVTHEDGGWCRLAAHLASWRSYEIRDPNSFCGFEQCCRKRGPCQWAEDCHRAWGLAPRRPGWFVAGHWPSYEGFKLPWPEDGGILQGSVPAGGQVPWPRAQPHHPMIQWSSWLACQDRVHLRHCPTRHVFERSARAVCRSQNGGWCRIVTEPTKL